MMIGSTVGVVELDCFDAADGVVVVAVVVEGVDEVPL